LNFAADEFINETRREISEFRKRASWLKRSGNITSIVVAVIVITALLQAVLRGIYAFGAQRQVKSIWVLFDQYTGLIWHFVAALPLPKTLPRNNDWAPWALTLAFYLSITLFCVALKSRAQRLRATADEAEKTLNFQAPLLMQMSAFAAAHGTAQSANIGSVSGSGNTVNATNTINHILHQADEKKWWEKPGGLLLVAAASAAINKALHLS
jgi:hypothetical protein